MVQQIARPLSSCIITWNIIFTLSLKNAMTRTSECFAFHHQPLSPHAVTVLRFCAILFLCGGQPPGQLPGIPPNSPCVNLSPSVTCSKQQDMPDVLGCCFWDQTTKALWHHSFALSSSLPQIPHCGEAQCPVKRPTWQGIDVAGPESCWQPYAMQVSLEWTFWRLPTAMHSHEFGSRWLLWAIKLWDGCSPDQHVDQLCERNCIRDSQLSHTQIPAQKLWDNNVSCFKLLTFRVICYATIENGNIPVSN